MIRIAAIIFIALFSGSVWATSYDATQAGQRASAGTLENPNCLDSGSKKAYNKLPGEGDIFDNSSSKNKVLNAEKGTGPANNGSKNGVN